ncbi:hypothetical protein ACWGJT_26125 [Streptomyces xantholiticus]
MNREQFSGLAHADHPMKSPIGARRSEWLHVYRDTFGFLSLVLRPTSG